MVITQYIPVLNQAQSFDEIIKKTLSVNAVPVFDRLTIDFLNDISRSILKNHEAGRLSELIAIAYFLRKGNIENLKNDFLCNINKQHVAVPRGIAFHIAPSNVDTIFMYSWALALLSGNINIVRVSQTLGFQLELLLNIISSVIIQPEYVEIAKRNFIITYPHNEQINTRLSEIADIRIIWGGDDTINNIRRFPAKPTTKEVVFADKVSFSVINSERYIKTDEKQCQELARLFYNDAYQFNQLACSSPQIVYFVGKTEENKSASQQFWSYMENDLKKRFHNDEPAVLMNKMVKMYEQAASGMNFSIKNHIENQKPTVINFSVEELEKLDGTCGGGYFYECFLENLDNLSKIIKLNNQTMSYFGFDGEELKNLASKLCGRGIDRIVPIGQSLNFMPVWDGYVLLNEFTKRVVIL